MRVLSWNKSPEGTSHAMVEVLNDSQLREIESFAKMWAVGSVRLVFEGNSTMLVMSDENDVDRLLKFSGQDQQ